MSYLNGKISEMIVVPVICGTEQGTAFFIDESHLLTARHVVRAYFDSDSAPTHIYLKVAGEQILCSADGFKHGEAKFDIAILSIADGEVYVSNTSLSLLKDSFVPDLKLKIYGYPNEVAMGESLVTLDVRNRLQIGGWNDRALVREDTLNLRYYDGLSGAPVVNNSGRVVGIVTIQNNQTLEYLSIDAIHSCLDDKGVIYSADWEKDDDTLLGQGRSLRLCEEAIKTVGDRYMPKLHQPNEELEHFLDTCTALGKITESSNCADEMAEFICELPQKHKDRIRENLKLDKNISYGLLIKDRYSLLERCYRFLDSSEFRNRLDMSEELKFHQLRYDLEHVGLEWAQGKDIKNICLIGKAGSGKTHTLCHFSRCRQEQANIYLFFGTEFNQHESIISHIKLKICQDESIEDFNQMLVEKKRYAVVVIDAINEGLGCTFWNSNLGGLRNELGKHSNIKLVVSIRSPFERYVNDFSENKNWEVKHIEGFVNLDQAINDYFEKYDINPEVRGKNIEGFKNPLFLKLFCETYHSLSLEERQNVTKRNLYKRYVEKKNGIISQQADEDPEINVTDKYLLNLANHSVFYNHCNPVSRQKARQLAKRLCPGRFWEKDLMHACLSSNILLDDLSNDGGKSVMFEYENLGDYYKAERMIRSKMDTPKLIDWIIEENKYFGSHKEVPSHKFESAVKALFDCWWQQKEDVSPYRQIQSDGTLYDLYVEFLNESDIPFEEYLDTLLRLDKNKVNPLRLIRDFDAVNFDEVLIIHKKLMAYRNVGARDVIWTRYVNQMYETYGDSYIDRVPIEEDSSLDVTDEEKKYLICITWMLTSSHPRFRAILTRKLRKILNCHKELVLWFVDLFETVNDPYVLIGLYSAIYGVVVVSRDKEFVSRVATHIYKYNYEQDANVPQDLIVRQWTLKIIERAYFLNSECDYWKRIQTPFSENHIDKNAVPDYYSVKRNKSHFGLQQGSMLMHDSIFDFEDFNRYIIGTNNHNHSCDYFLPTEEGGKYSGVPLTDIMAELSYYITDVFGWNDKLGYLDNGKYSRSRSHNVTERIGKKFQWLAWYRLNARLMDSCRVSREQYFYGDKAEEKDLTVHPMPWNTSEVSRFDPTLEPELAYAPEGELTGTERLPIDGVENDDWITNNAYLPIFRYQAYDKNGVEFVLLMGYDTTKGDKGNETFLFSNAGFVHKKDAKRFADWMKVKNFYGRWMPERRGMTEYMWNEYPWADSYKTNTEEYDVWEQPQDCPIEMMLSYESQLQEDWEGIDENKEFLTTVYMPARDMMEQLGLYCTEVRGVIKTSNDEVAAINTGHGNCVSGLFIRKDLLDGYLAKNDYVMFYYVLGEKVHKLTGVNTIMKDLSAAFQYNPDGDLIMLQSIRVIERENPKPHKRDRKKIDELKKKNHTEGLLTRELLELIEMESDLPEDDEDDDEIYSGESIANKD